MRGTRYGDFSRFIDELDHPAGSLLLMQQGRVQLDADWNAQAELAERRLVGAISDMLGSSGGPAAEPGFEIRALEALEFRGGGAVRTRHHLPLGLPGGGSFTIELRVRWGGGAGTLIDLVSDRGDPSAHYQLRVRDDGAVVLRQHAPEHGRSDETEIVASEALSQSAVAQVALVCRQGEATIWVNARPLASGPLTHTPAARLRSAVIGGTARSGGRARYFTGMIGDVRIWSVARDASDLGAAIGDSSLPAESASGRDAIPAGLLAWWPLDSSTRSGGGEVVSGHPITLEGDIPPLWRLNDLRIEPGRYYVSGVPVSLDSPVSYTAQPFLANAFPPVGSGRYLVYLEVWEDTVSAAEDSALLEPALPGLDTTVRAELRWTVRCIAAPPVEGENLDAERLLYDGLAAAGPGTTGTIAAEHAGAPLTGNWLYRVEIHQGGFTQEKLTEVAIVDIDPQSGQVTLAEAWPSGLASIEEVEVVGLAADGSTVTVTHAVGPADGDNTGQTVQLATDPSGLTELQEPRLRRLAPRPTFKWSRRNGSDTLLLAPIRGATKKFELLSGSVELAALRPPIAVEVLADPASLGSAPQPIRQIVAVDPDRQQITLDHAPPAAAQNGLRLRIWDQAPTGTGTLDGAALIQSGTWVELESGIRVRFDEGLYRAGDYWWIVARQAQQGAIVWPTRHGHPAAQAPDGVVRRHAPLALLDIGDTIEVRDLRGIMRPLVSAPGLGEPGSAPRGPGEAAAPGSPPSAGASSAGTPAAPTAGGEGASDEFDDDVGWPAIPPGFALLGPPDATAPGFRATELELVTAPPWTAPVPLGLAEGTAPVALVALSTRLLLITGDAVWSIDPATAQTSRLASLPERRERFACAAYGDTVFLIGGRRPGGRPDGRLLSFDAAEGTWLTGRQPLPTPLDEPAAAVLESPGGGARAMPQLHVLGGAQERAERPTRLHQIYDVSADNWSSGPAFTVARKGAAAGVLDGKLHLIGGSAGRRRDEAPLDSDEVFDQETQAWTESSPLPVPAAIVSATGQAAQLVVAASPSRHRAVTLSAYDDPSGTWEPLPRLPARMHEPKLAVHENRLFMVGLDRAGQVVMLSLPEQRAWVLFVQEEAAS